MYISKKVLAVIGVLIAAMLIVGIGFAQGTDEVIHACVNRAQQIRIVDAPEDCRVYETNLDWNVQGVPGEDGEDGEDGEPGEPGPPGVVDFYGYAQQNITDCQPGAECNIAMSCLNGGDEVVSGGYILPKTGGFLLFQNRPEGDDTWVVGIMNISDSAIPMTTYIRCADLTP